MEGGNKRAKVGAVISTRADEDWNSVPEVGFLGTHHWWMSKALQSKNRKCTMTHQFLVLKERDESQYDSRALTLSGVLFTHRPLSPRDTAM